VLALLWVFGWVVAPAVLHPLAEVVDVAGGLAGDPDVVLVGFALVGVVG
jgi:hypothetical protein